MDSGRTYTASENGADHETAGRVVEGDGKKITGWAAAEIIGVSDRTMRRWRERFVMRREIVLEIRGEGGSLTRPPPRARIAARGIGCAANFSGGVWCRILWRRPK